jgi:hypothetical protein
MLSRNEFVNQLQYYYLAFVASHTCTATIFSAGLISLINGIKKGAFQLLASYLNSVIGAGSISVNC